MVLIKNLIQDNCYNYCLFNCIFNCIYPSFHSNIFLTPVQEEIVSGPGVRESEQTNHETEQDSQTLSNYEVHVTCPKLTISGDSGILDPDYQSLNGTLDLRSTDSNASIDIGTQSDLSFLSPIKHSEGRYGTKRPPLEMSPDLAHKFKRMKFSRQNVKARPPLRRRKIKKSKPTGDSDYILSVSPEKTSQSTLRETANKHLLGQTCTLQ